MGGLGDFEKTRVLYIAMAEKPLEWPKVVTVVSFPTFWGVFKVDAQDAGGSLI